MSFGPAYADPTKKAIRVDIVSGSTGGGSSVQFYTNDVDEVSDTLTYVGKETSDGFWLIQKIDSTSGTQIRYASSVNNSAYTDYSTAWTNRASLTYGLASEVFD